MTTYVAVTYPADSVTKTFVSYSPMTYDYPVRSLWGTKTWAGTAYRKSDGSVITGLTVYLVRSDGLLCGSTVTDGSGHFSFTRDAADPYTYKVESTVNESGVNLHGTTDWGIAPT